MVSWPGDLLCIAGLAWDYRAGFALPREPWVKLDRARAGSARQSTAGRNELDTGKPRLMFASEEEPAGYWLPGQGLISPVQAWPAWTEHRRCSAVGAQIHQFGRGRKGQTEAGTAAQIGARSPALPHHSASRSLETLRPSYVRSVAADPLEASPTVLKGCASRR
jgi:hypothetical protein